MSKLLFALPIGLVASAVPAKAADFFADHDGWTVFKSDDSCSMTMEYEGAGETQLLLMKDLDNEIKVFVGNYGWSAKEDQKYELSYLLNGNAYSGTSTGLKIGIKSGFAASFGEEFGRDLALGQSLRIYMGKNLVDQLSLSGTAKALNLVDQCLARLRTAKKAEEREKARLAHIPQDPFSPSDGGPLAETMKVAAKPPTPRNSSAWMQRISEDYPRRALQEEWQGVVSVQLNISVDGRVAKCTVTGSSGYTILDDAACVGFERYGRFEPANDEYGKSVEGSYSTRLTYGLK